MIFNIDTSRFPRLEKGIRAHWAPILLEPISGSYERLVIGVVAANQSGYHVELANSLNRLDCFYGPNAVAIRFAIELTGKSLREDLSARSVEALRAPDTPLSGVFIGECREAEGSSLEGLAQSWMAALSSLYSPNAAAAEFVGAPIDITATLNGADTVGSGDRLPFLVCDYVKTQREGFGRYFSADLREGGARRARGNSHRVQIDYAGPRLVANFGTLKAGSITSSVYLIKRRLWDLKVERDREPNVALARAHEMILQRPLKDDPQVTARQQESISEALSDLEGQADQEDLRLLAFDNVSQIGQRLMKLEHAA